MAVSLISWAQCMAMLFLCIASSYSDRRTGQVPNKLLAGFAVIATALFVPEYCLLHRELLPLFAINYVFMFVLSLALYFAGVWAGGDCKLSCTLGLLYPAEMALEIGGIPIYLPVAILNAFCLGYLYIVARAIGGMRRTDISKLKPQAAEKVKALVLSIIRTLGYLATARVLLHLIAPNLAQDHPVIQAAICALVALASGKISILKSKGISASAIAVACVAAAMLQVNPLPPNPACYIVIIVVCVSQVFAAQLNYQTIPTSSVEEGMILSTVSSIVLSQSRVKGLPGLSDETLSSRLSDEEAESVRRWEKSARGQDEITIVRKIPFALFTSIGFLSLVAMRGLL